MPFRVRGRRSETGQFISGTIGAIGAMWIAVAVVGAWSRTTVGYIGPTFPSPMPMGGLLLVLVAFVGGLTLGALGWIVLVEQRRPDRPRYRWPPWREAVPNALATGVMIIGVQLVPKDSISEEWLTELEPPAMIASSRSALPVPMAISSPQ